MGLLGTGWWTLDWLAILLDFLEPVVFLSGLADPVLASAFPIAFEVLLVVEILVFFTGTLCSEGAATSKEWD